MVSEAEGIELPPPMPLKVTEKEDDGDWMPKSTFLKKRLSESDSFQEEHSPAFRYIPNNMRRRRSSVLTSYDSGDDDVSSIPGSVETSERVSVVSTASRTSTSFRNIKWGHQVGVEEIDYSVNALVPNILVKQLVDSLGNYCDLSPRQQQMSALREAVSKYQSHGSIRRHRGALLFVDISGFTNLAQMYPVEDFKTFINEYFTKIINLIVSFGGEVVKFAGDALYAMWSCPTIEKSSATLAYHTINITKCTACAIAISSECNNYKISKSYNRRNSADDDRAQGEVLYKYQDKDAEYEERGAKLNVYCGVSHGIMAGIDVVSSNRAEFFLIGDPLKGR